MDASDFIGHVHDLMERVAREDSDVALDHEPGFKGWHDLDPQEVERVGRSLADLFGITLDE